MTRNKFENSWNKFKGKIKKKWGKLTDSDVSQINGNYDQFLGTMHKRYGYERDRAEREFANWNWENDMDLEEGSWERDRERDTLDQDTYKGKDREYGESDRGERKGGDTRFGEDRDQNDRDKRRKAG